MVRENFKGASFNSCFAVFDGHGGQRAAEFARTRLGPMLEASNEIETNVMGSVKQGKSILSRSKAEVVRRVSPTPRW